MSKQNNIKLQGQGVLSLLANSQLLHPTRSVSELQPKIDHDNSISPYRKRPSLAKDQLPIGSHSQSNNRCRGGRNPNHQNEKLVRSKSELKMIGQDNNKNEIVYDGQVSRFPSINRFKSVTLDVELQESIRERLKAKGPALKPINKQKVTKKVAEGPNDNQKSVQDEKAVEGTAADGGTSKIFYINNLSNLGLGKIGQSIEKNRIIMFDRMFSKFKELEKRQNKFATEKYERKLRHPPHELTTKKMKYEEFAHRSKSTTQDSSSHRKFKMVFVKQAETEPVVAPVDHSLNGWEAEEEADFPCS